MPSISLTRVTEHIIHVSISVQNLFDTRTNHIYYTQLHYVTNVIKENLRLQPPAALIFSRMAEQDLEFEGQIIPKGVRCCPVISLKLS